MLKKHLDYWLLAALAFFLVAIVAPTVTSQVVAPAVTRQVRADLVQTHHNLAENYAL